MPHLQYVLSRLAVGFFFYLILITPTFSLTFVLPDQGDIVGHVQWTRVLADDTFSKIGRRYDIGYFELVEANPGLDPEHPLPGSILVIPSRFILPSGQRRGIVINLAELRVYYYPLHRRVVMTYPVGIGREGWSTPLGPSSISEKVVDPTWYVPASIRKDRAKEGVYLPKKVSPGPDNPLGGYAMRLQQTTYLIHGTNDYQGVGRRSSAGCIRLLPEDMEELFLQVKPKERVYVIDSPYKVGWYKDHLYLEAHVPLQEQGFFTRATMEKVIQSRHAKITGINWKSIRQVAIQQNGIPQIIGYTKGAISPAPDSLPKDRDI